jgi:hypothetical protein
MTAQCTPSMRATIRGPRVESLRIHCAFSFVAAPPPSPPPSLPHSNSLPLFSSHFLTFPRIASHFLALPHISSPFIAFPRNLPLLQIVDCHILQVWARSCISSGFGNLRRDSQQLLVSIPPLHHILLITSCLNVGMERFAAHSLNHYEYVCMCFESVGLVRFL